MIVRKYQDSTRRQTYSESIDSFSKYLLIQEDLLMFWSFQKLLSENTKISRTKILCKRSEIPIFLEAFQKTYQQMEFGRSTKFDKFSKFQKVEIWTIKRIKDDSIIVLVFLEVFLWKKGGVKVHPGSNKNQVLGSSGNHLKSIGIGPGTLISHLRII